MLVLQWVLYWGLPALAAALVWVGILGPRCTALAIATAVVVPFVMAVGWPGWPWQHSDAWFVWAVAAGGLAGTAQDLRLLPRWFAPIVDAALLAALPWLLLTPQRASWSFETALLHLTVAWLAFGCSWLALRSGFTNRPGLIVPIAAALCLGGDALVVGHHDMQAIAAAAGLSLLVAATTALWRAPFVCGAGTALAVTVVHGGVLLVGYYTGHLGLPAALLALLAPLPLGLALRAPVGRGRSSGNRMRTALGLLLTAALIGAAFWAGRN